MQAMWSGDVHTAARESAWLPVTSMRLKNGGGGVGGEGRSKAANAAEHDGMDIAA
jgi:hypothetical protein